jgi:transposase
LAWAVQMKGFGSRLCWTRYFSTAVISSGKLWKTPRRAAQLVEHYPFWKGARAGCSGMRITPRPELSSQDEAWLRKQATSAVAPRRLVERCRIILRAAQGETNEQIAVALGMTRQKAARWRARFAEGGRAGLEQDAPGRGRKPTYGPEIQQLIVERTLRTKPPAATHWSQRTLAQALDVSSRTIGRVWQAHGLKPHLVRTFKVSNDPRLAAAETADRAQR